MNNPALSGLESRYEIVKRLGGGGMGEVFLARHRLLNVHRVIKTIRPEHQAKENSRARFIREAQVAAELEHHQNVARLYEFELGDEGTAIMIMEFIDGRDLTSITRGSPVPVNVAIEIADQALSALGYLHRNNFVHRDVSPDNLMLTKDTQGQILVKLIDLGIAKSLEGSADLTVPGSFVGKLRYAAPEHFTSGDAGSDPRSDLYSLGIVLYELVTGQHPIEGKTPSAIVASQMHSPPRSFDQTDPHGQVPESVRRVILKALEKKPDRRFPTAQHFRDALSAARPEEEHVSLEETMKIMVSSFDSVIKPRGLADKTVTARPGTGSNSAGAAGRLVEHARDLFDQGDTDGAREFLVAAAKLDSDLPAIAQLESEIERKAAEKRLAEISPEIDRLLAQEHHDQALKRLDAATDLASEDRAVLAQRIEDSLAELRGAACQEIEALLDSSEPGQQILEQARAELSAARVKLVDGTSIAALEKLEQRIVALHDRLALQQLLADFDRLLADLDPFAAQALLDGALGERIDRGQIDQAQKMELAERLDSAIETVFETTCSNLEQVVEQQLARNNVGEARALLAQAPLDQPTSPFQKFEGLESRDTFAARLRQLLERLEARVVTTEQRLNAAQVEQQVDQLLEAKQLRQARDLIESVGQSPGSALKPEDRERLVRKIEQFQIGELRRARDEIETVLDQTEVGPAQLAAARDLLSAAIVDFGGQPMLREIEQRIANAERRLEVSQLIDRAERLAEGSSLHAALEHLGRAAELAPDNQRVGQLSTQYRETLEREQQRASRKAALEQVVARVQDLIDEGDLEGAESELRQAEQELGEHKQVQRLREDLDQARKLEQLETASKLVARAEQLRALGDLDGARIQLQEALAGSPNYAPAIEALEALARSQEDALRKAKIAREVEAIESLAERGRFDEALTRLEEAKQQLGREAAFETLNRRIERQQRFNVELSEARQLLSQRSFEQAESRLNELYESHRDSNQELAEEIAALLEDVRRRRTEAERRSAAAAARDEIEQLLKSGTLGAARQQLDQAVASWHDVADFSDQSERLGKLELDQELSLQVEKARDSIRGSIEAGRLSVARAELTRARKTYDDDQRLTVLEHELESALQAERAERSSKPNLVERMGAPRLAAAGLALVVVIGLAVTRPWAANEPDRITQPVVTDTPAGAQPGEATEDWSQLDFGNYHALVIGNNDYQELTDLDTARNDATELANVLEQRYGFQVERLFDATRREILLSLAALKNNLGEDDNLLVFYAGHGHTDEAMNQGYWEGVDAKLDSRFNSIPNVEVIGHLEDMKARQVLVIADSCFSGELIRADPQSGNRGGEEFSVEERLQRKGRLVITSGNDLPIRDSGGDDHSVFSGALLEVLKRGDRLIPAGDLFSAVREKTIATSQGLGLDQDPQMARLGVDQGGDFFFLPQGGVDGL